MKFKVFLWLVVGVLLGIGPLEGMRGERMSFSYPSFFFYSENTVETKKQDSWQSNAIDSTHLQATTTFSKSEWGKVDFYGRVGIEQDSRSKKNVIYNDCYVYPGAGVRFWPTSFLFGFVEGRYAFETTTKSDKSSSDFRTGAVLYYVGPYWEKREGENYFALENYAEGIYSSRQLQNFVIDWKAKFFYRNHFTSHLAGDVYLGNRFMWDSKKLSYNHRDDIQFPAMRVVYQQLKWSAQLDGFHSWRYPLNPHRLGKQDGTFLHEWKMQLIVAVDF